MKISEATLAAEAKNTRVRTPRGSVSLTASKGMPPMRGDPLLKKGVADFEVCGERQKGDWSGFSQHSLGELLMGIAEGDGRLGNEEKVPDLRKMIAAWAGPVCPTRLPSRTGGGGVCGGAFDCGAGGEAGVVESGA